VPTPARKAQKTKKTARAGVRRTHGDPKSTKLAKAEAGYKEALEQQAATAEILRALSRSSGNTQAVLDAIVKSAHRLCGALFSILYRYDGHLLTVAADSQDATASRVLRSLYPQPAQPNHIIGCTVLLRQAVHTPDITLDKRFPSNRNAHNKLVRFRAALAVPLLRDGVAVGAIAAGRLQAQPFTEREIGLLQTFADQAVIAIENVRLFNETKEALEQQTATSDILKVISASPTDVQPVFDTIVRNSVALCEGHFGALFTFDGKMIGLGAQVQPDEHTRDLFRRAFPQPITPTTPSAIAILECRVVNVPDMTQEDYAPDVKERAVAGGYRAVLTVPMMKGDTPIGAIAVTRREPTVFSESYVALLKTFADQAVIAIENARLFNETKEALERQTATAEILASMSGSMSDAQPVFDAIVGSLRRLLGTPYAVVALLQDGKAHLKAIAGDARFTTRVKGAYPWSLDDPGMVAAKAVHDRKVVQFQFTPGSRDVPEKSAQLARELGYQSIIFAPLLRQGEAIGFIGTPRTESAPADAKLVALIRSFADQAVIAIENVRLFNETKEALERQTATAEILKVISSSTTDTQPVFEAIVRAAVRLFPMSNATIFMRDGALIRLRAIAGEGVDEVLRRELASIYPIPFDPAVSTSARAMLERRANICLDTEAPGVAEHIRRAGRAGRFRSNTVVPLVREDEGIGSMVITNPQAGYRLNDKQLDLLRTFADQAVIAIENVRLFNETKEALEHQTATSGILGVISSSPTDTAPVFEAIARNGLKLFSGASVTVLKRIGETIDIGAVTHIDPQRAQRSRALYPVPLTRDYLSGRAILDGVLTDVPDLDHPDPDLPAVSTALLRELDYCAMTVAPMLIRDRGIGAIAVGRHVAGPLSEKQIALLRTFADQAVIAIENARLFNDTKEALEQQKASAEVLAAISSSIADTSPVFDKILEGCERLFQGQYMGIGLAGDDGHVNIVARRGLKATDDIGSVGPIPATKDSGTGLAILERRIVHFADLPGSRDVPPVLRRNAERVGLKSIIFAPMFWDDKVIGTVYVGRRFAGAFTEKQVALLRTFADQAVIAIQNARLFHEIQEKSRQLEEASRHKSHFLASMSHELRTPLNAILGFNEMILGGIYGDVPGDMTEPLRDMATSGKHLLRLINNVLDLAKIEAGRMELALGDYSVQDTVAGVHATLRPLAAEKGLEFMTEVPADVPLAWGDGGRIAQCLMNLAGNSLKFTKHGKVAIHVQQENGVLRYSVTDTGIGIPPDKIGSLFTEFKQTDATIASEFGGTGLGLSITKKFIEMHGGRIWVESEPGKGSAFRFEIPLRVSA
jgi:GAF domain-containing protein